MAKVLSQQMKAILDDAIQNKKQILIVRGRSYGKRLLQNYAMLKEWPEGKILNVNHDGIKESELADAEEIK